MRSMQGILATVWRGAAVGVAYIAAMMLAGIVFGVLGLVPAASGDAAVGLLWTLVAGILLGLYVGPLAAHTTATRRQHVLIWTAVIFFNMGAVMLEGAYFAPELVPISPPLLAVQQFLAALVAGSLVALLFARSGQTAAFLATLRRRCVTHCTYNQRRRPNGADRDKHCADAPLVGDDAGQVSGEPGRGDGRIGRRWVGTPAATPGRLRRLLGRADFPTLPPTTRNSVVVIAGL